MDSKAIINKKTLLPALVILGLLIVTTIIISGKDPATGQQARGSGQPVGVETARAEIRHIRDMRVFSGTLAAENQYDAAAKVAGQVRQLNVNLGDCVTRGALIARLDSEEYEQALAQAQAELEVARASLLEARSALSAAERDFRRVSDLRAQRVASAADLDQAETAKQAAEARLSLAQAQIAQRDSSVRSAEIRLSYTEIHADWENGEDDLDSCRYVAARHVDQGATIAANAPVVTLVDLTSLNAVIHVAERDYARLRIGQKADIRVDSVAGRAFEGTISRMAPVFAETSRQARIEVRTPNPDNILKAGMFARVEIELENIPEALAIPVSGLIRRGGEKGVFAVNDQRRATFIPVREGVTDRGWVQIMPLEERPNGQAADQTEGIEPGMEPGIEIVTLGHHLLSDGSRVATADNERDNDRDGR